MSQEPAIDFGQFEHVLDRHAQFKCVPQKPWARRIGNGQLGPDLVAIGLFVGSPEVFVVAAEAKTANFEAAECFLKGLFESSSDGHRLADAFHLSRQRVVGFGKLLEGEAWKFGDDIVDRRLEAGLGFLGDIVLQFP